MVERVTLLMIILGPNGSIALESILGGLLFKSTKDQTLVFPHSSLLRLLGKLYFFFTLTVRGAPAIRVGVARRRLGCLSVTSWALAPSRTECRGHPLILSDTRFCPVG